MVQFVLSTVSRIIYIYVTETFFVDLVLRNPLDVEVNLSNVTIVVEESRSDDPSTSKPFLDVEVVEDIVLAPRESRTVRLHYQFLLCAKIVARSRLP